jgi:signal transduction histidine kinase
MQKRYIRKDGLVIWAELTASLIRDAQGAPLFAVSMVEDITDRKQMEAELAEVQYRLMAGREQERMQLAQEIHDVPLQDLYVLLYQLNEMQEAIGDAEQFTELKDAQADGLRQVINTLRAICGELRSPTLSPFGLEGAIREHAESFQVKHPNLNIQLELMHDDQDLAEDVRLNLFRIYQQAVNNVIRHAQASEVIVRFSYDENQVVLEIEDNGQGFEVPNRWIGLARQGHLGLVGAAERTEIIGGSFRVTSMPGKGTLVRVVVPRVRTTEQEIVA